MATEAVSPTPAEAKPGMPKDIHYAHIFQIFNTISYLIVLGIPMLLFFKRLGASATILGIVAALPPLLNILQIPAANLLEKFGYRTFVVQGWALRSFIIIGMVTVPLLTFVLDGETCMMLMLFLLFTYNTSRGISLCGFLPWMTQLVPEGVRGTFISRDQSCGALASFATLLAASWIFHGTHTVFPFAISFAISFLAAMASLFYLRKIPDVPVPEESRGKEKVPWKQMFFYRPFLKLLMYNIMVNAALAAAGVFWVPALRDLFQWNDSQIMTLSALTSVFAIGVIYSFGKMVDRVGSRPLLAFSGCALVIHFSMWAGIVTRLIPINFFTLAFLQMMACFGGSIFSMANTRLVMGTVPAMGRSHFFALFSVITSLTLGLLPILWGIALDGLSTLHLKLWDGDFNRYSVLYVTLTVIVLFSLYGLKELEEPRAMTTEAFFYELLVRSPSRALTRLIRRPVL